LTKLGHKILVADVDGYLSSRHSKYANSAADILRHECWHHTKKQQCVYSSGV